MNQDTSVASPGPSASSRHRICTVLSTRSIGLTGFTAALSSAPAIVNG
jgi:hypothetical protein